MSQSRGETSSTAKNRGGEKARGKPYILSVFGIQDFRRETRGFVEKLNDIITLHSQSDITASHLNNIYIT